MGFAHKARWDKAGMMSAALSPRRRRNRVFDVADSQSQVAKLVACYPKELKMSPSLAALDVVSEIGEVAKAILEATDYGRSKRKPFSKAQLKEELGDVLYSIILLANSVGIDLTLSLQAALRKIEQRVRTQGHAGSRRRGPNSR